MRKKIYLLFAYIGYLLKAKGINHLHSPFLFNFYKNIISDKTPVEGSEKIENVRQELLNKRSLIDSNDFGAGAEARNGTYRVTPMRKVADIAASSLSSEKKCHFLYTLATYFKPDSVIELGTSFGISSMYLALALPEKPVYTIEGCSQILALSQKYFANLGFNNIKSTNSLFDTALPDILKELGQADLVFIDGNHRKEPTIKYFNIILPYIHNDTIIIIDDIHWSSQMNQAWDILNAYPEVTLSVDLFYIGVLFFKKELSKQNFVLRF